MSANHGPVFYYDNFSPVCGKKFEMLFGLEVQDL